MTAPIRSASNPLIRRVAALLTDPARRAEEGLCVLEGIRLAGEALDSGVHLERALVDASRLGDERLAERIAALERRGVPVVPVAGAALRSASDADAPAGIILLAARRPAELKSLSRGADPLLAVAWRIQDPGNLGAIVRSAEAAGASGVAVVAGGADPWHPRAIRASAGSLLRLPVTAPTDPDTLLDHLREAGIALVAGVAAGGIAYDRADLIGATAILVGNEGAGLPEEIAERARRVTIPMQGRVESLNVAVSAALLLFEAARQRRREP